MNFFDTQDRSYRNTRKLVLLMTLAVVVVVAAVTLVIVLAAWAMTAGNLGGITLTEWIGRRPYTPIAIAGATAAFIGLASLYRMAGLRQGGGRVARDLGGTLVVPGETDPLRRRLRNVVEEMAIASGVPAPEIYVLEHEPAINAFAAGFRPEDAAIAVTRGALETLSRDELQGVIAHEFSHVLNGDMRLNIRLMGPMFGILAIGLLGRMLVRSGRRTVGFGRRGTGSAMPALALGAGLSIIGSIGMLLARLIKAGVSRQREYLADASAVQFTRQTQGLAGALKKIAGLRERSMLAHATTEEISHMLFASGLRSIAGLFATHPPLFERIRALDSAFTEEEFRELRTEAVAAAILPSDDAAIAGLAADAGRASLQVTDAESVLRTVGNPDDRHYENARALHGRIPPSLRDVLESHYQVILLVVAFILHPDRDNRQAQLATIEQQLGKERRGRVEQLYAEISRLARSARLPLLDLALPLVKERPAAQLEFLSQLLEQLAAQNNYLELFEYTLLRIFQSYVRRSQDPTRRRRWSGLEDIAMQQAAVTLLQVFAAHGHDDVGNAANALETGLAALGAARAVSPLPANWAGSCDDALATLTGCIPRDRETVIRALIATAIHDGRISVAESELLRAFCAILECPLPPLLAAQ